MSLPLPQLTTFSLPFFLHLPFPPLSLSCGLDETSNGCNLKDIVLRSLNFSLEIWWVIWCITALNQLCVCLIGYPLKFHFYIKCLFWEFPQLRKRTGRGVQGGHGPHGSGQTIPIEKSCMHCCTTNTVSTIHTLSELLYKLTCNKIKCIMIVNKLPNKRKPLS